MNRTQIEETLKEIIIKRAPGLKPEMLAQEVEMATLGVDSLAFSWILADMEEAFGFVTQGADVMKLKTFADSLDYVQKQLSK